MTADDGQNEFLHSGEQQRKRRRVTRACDICKSRKRRCTGDVPCTSCVSHGVVCTYLASYNRGKVVEPSPSGKIGVNTRMSSEDDVSNEAILAGGTTQIDLDADEAANEPASGAFAGQYLGPSSPYSFLRRAWKRFGTVRETFEYSDGNSGDLTSTTGNIFQYGDRHPPDLDPAGTSLINLSRMSSLVGLYFELASPTYRFLHEPSVLAWLSELQNEGEHTVPLQWSQKAVAKLVMAIAGLYDGQDGEAAADSAVSHMRSSRSERLYADAKEYLDREGGKPSVYSVQGRLTACQYLLCTSRPSEAWYALGTAAQLIMALGMHRRKSFLGTETNIIVRECRKRVLWTACVLDTYLSAMLGRPHLIHDEDVDQELPMAVDDRLLSGAKASNIIPNTDCSMSAAVQHARLVTITKRVSKAQSLVSRRGNSAYLTVASRINDQLSEWKRSLPVFLSGAVHPTTLMPLYRRQLVVLSLAHAHAAMLLGRPLLLTDIKEASTTQLLVDQCLTAAKVCLDIMTEMADQQRSFTAFWNTHYIIFSALTIAYIWIIQRRNERLPSSKAIADEKVLFELAELVRNHLDKVTIDTAPSFRYSIILEELSQEAACWRSKPMNPLGSELQTSATNGASETLLTGIEVDGIMATMSTPLDWDASLFFPSDADLWSQLDTFPFSHIDMPQSLERVKGM